MWKSHEKPNPLTPFPTREGGKFKVSLLLGERFRERFSRYREKSEQNRGFFVLGFVPQPNLPLLLIFISSFISLETLKLNWSVNGLSAKPVNQF
jgi:hypothetical protein